MAQWTEDVEAAVAGHLRPGENVVARAVCRFSPTPTQAVKALIGRPDGGGAVEEVAHRAAEVAAEGGLDGFFARQQHVLGWTACFIALTPGRALFVRRFVGSAGITVRVEHVVDRRSVSVRRLRRALVPPFDLVAVFRIGRTTVKVHEAGGFGLREACDLLRLA